MRGFFTRTIGKEIRGLHEAAYLVAGFGFLGQLVALARDRTFAHVLGAGETLDLYYAAFRIPDVLFAAVASLASLYVLIPFLERYEREGQEAVRRFVSEIFTLLAGAVLVVAVILAIFAQPLTALLYPGIVGDARDSLVQLVRVMLLQPVLLSISSLLLALVQSAGRYVLYALAPVLYNLGILLGALVLYPVVGVVGLGYGVVLGAFLHLAIQLPFLIQVKRLPYLVVDRFTVPVGKIVRTSLPRTLTLSLQQLSLLALISFASAQGAGSVALFSLAANLQAVPLSLIGASYSVAAFPILAKLYVEGNVSAFVEKARTALQHTLFWALPAALGLCLTSVTFVTIVLQSGAFGQGDVRTTAHLLTLFALSLPAQALVLLFVRMSYAMGNTRTPLLAGSAGALVTVLLAWAATGHLVGPLEGELAALVLAFSAGAWGTALYLFVALTRTVRSLTEGLYSALTRNLIACIALGGVYSALYVLMRASPNELLPTLVSASCGTAAWLVVHLLMKSPELSSLRFFARRRAQ